MIELHNVTKTYKDFNALDDISFSIASGETAVFVGPSGSGKTTLLRLIAGLETPDDGRVVIQGNAASGPGKIVIPPNRRNIAMIFQDLALWPHMTVMKNLAFVLKSQQLSKREQMEKIDHICSQVGLNSHLKAYPHTLSGGEKQRVAIARAILCRPKIMLMDEPLTSLDTVLKGEILEMIIHLTREFQMTLMYVTHDREETFQLAGRVFVMMEGRISQKGKIEAIFQNPQTRFAEKFFRRR